MSTYGVTPAGFVVKPFLDILNDKLALAQSLFGPDVDLRSTSALRRILDIASTEDHEHWKALEGGFYGNYITTANGAALDLLGDDLGLQRQNQLATGQVTFTLAGEAPGRNYILPVGTLVETAAPVVSFRTTAATTLSSTQINPIFAGHYLSLGTATIAASNSLDFTGGDQLSDDKTYRAQLLRLPRAVFTIEAVRAAVQNVDGVRDCRVGDELGGVDVALSFFNSFAFDRRRFGQARLLGTPYFFDILVAPKPGYAWDTMGTVTGLYDQVAAAVDVVRPVGIFPNIHLADNVTVGLRAKITTGPGMDLVGVGAALKTAFEQRIGTLGLGGSVLASQVLRDLLNVPGVVDVQNLHLRRYPPTFGTIVFGDREVLQSTIIEADIGANLTLTSNEIATFVYDSQLIDLQVSDR
jgi:Baseplate J-like protein